MTNAAKNSANLEITTPSDRELVMTRVFDAPREMVFDAWTRPELLKRWLGARPPWYMAVCEVDLQVGGEYRYVWRGPDGTTMGLRGVYREIVPPERLVGTEKFNDYPGEVVGTTVLVEQGGKTTLRLTEVYDSKESRDAALKSGMEYGVEAGYDRLAGILANTLTQTKR